MLELALQILFCLLLAALLGFIIGWLLGRLRVRREVEETRLAWAGKLKDCEGRLGVANADLHNLQQELRATEANLSATQGGLAQMGELETRLADQTSRYATLEVDLTALKRKLAERDAQVSSLSADLGACQENAASLQAQVSAPETKIQPWAGTGDAAPEAEIGRLKAHIAELKAKARDYVAGRLPGALTERPDTIDNLEDINGVGPVLETMLNEMGIYYFRQVATWSEEDIDFAESRLERFKGRIRREDWVGSAQEEHFKKYGVRL